MSKEMREHINTFKNYLNENINNNFKKGDFVRMLSNNKIYVIMSDGRVSDTSKKVIYVYVSFNELVKKHPLDIINGKYEWKYLSDDMVEKLSENELPYEKWMIDLCKLNSSVETRRM